MISDKLLDLDYYLDKLSMYFRRCYGIEEQFAMLNSIMRQLNSTLDFAYERLDVMNTDYINMINRTQTETDIDESDILDKIASIYGVARTFSVSYTTSSTSVTDKQISLNNEELVVLIKARIIQNTYKGTYEECMSLYRLIGLDQFIIINNDVEDATCNMYLQPQSSENIQDMFLAGLLSLESLGITYNYDLVSATSLGLWDVSDWDDTTRLWS